MVDINLAWVDKADLKIANLGCYEAFFRGFIKAAKNQAFLEPKCVLIVKIAKIQKYFYSTKIKSALKS